MPPEYPIKVLVGVAVKGPAGSIPAHRPNH